jgi:hypothetical protein
MSPAPGTFLLLNLTPASGHVTITLAPGTKDGQTIGAEVTSESSTYVAIFTGSVDSSALPLGRLGDCTTFIWSTLLGQWRLVSWRVAPGWFPFIPSVTVGLYRFHGPSNFATDYSGNGRTLTGAGASFAPGPGANRGACRNSTFIGKRLDAAFQLKAAMSVLIHYNVKGTVPNTNMISCGTPGNGVIQGVVWAWGHDGGNQLQYSQLNNGIAVNYLTGTAPTQVGWLVSGFTRTAGGVVRAYINGTLTGTSTALALPTDSATNSVFAIGGYDNNGAPFSNGDIAQCAVYNTDLSLGQMQTASKMALGSYY